MNIIVETIVGIIVIIFVVGISGWFLFREQFERAVKYVRLWAEQDAKNEAKQIRLQEQLKTQKEEAEMREARARERAEAELEDFESGSQI